MNSAGSASTTAHGAGRLKVITGAGPIEHATMTSVHAYTSDQILQDYAGPDYRCSRAAAENIIPTSTGAAKAVGEVLPELNGRLDGIASRVPVPDGLGGGPVRGTGAAGERRSRARGGAVRRRLPGRLNKVLEFTREPVLSSDIIGNPHSSIYDASFTQVTGGRFLKALCWYDNEWGYSNRVCGLLAMMAELD